MNIHRKLNGHSKKAKHKASDFKPASDARSLAYAAKDKHAYEAAAQLFGQSYAQTDDLNDRGEEIKAYIQLGLLSTAEFKIKQARELTSASGFALLDAYVKVHQGKNQKAVDIILPLFSETGEAFDYAQAFFVLLTALNGLGDYERSIKHGKFAIAQFPEDDRIWLRYCEALNALRKSEEVFEVLEPRFEQGNLSDALIAQLALAHSFSDDQQRALELYNAYDEKRPGNPLINWNRSLTLLRLGKIEEGWKQYFKRWEWAGFPSPHRKFNKPLWAHGAENGRVLLWTEQGIGDELRFLSLLDKFAEVHGNNIVLEVQPKFIESYKRTFSNIEVRPAFFLESMYSPREDFDSHLPIGSLPHILNLPRDAFKRGAYIKTDPLRDFFWKDKMVRYSEKPKIGLAWRSKVMEGRSQWYTDINYWRDLILRDDISVISLQYDDISKDLAVADPELVDRLYIPEFLDQMDDLEGAFSLIKAMDFVITPGTSVAVMASAVGVPTLSYGPLSPMSLTSTPHMHEFPWHENHWYVPITTVTNSSEMLHQSLHVIDQSTKKPTEEGKS